MLTQSNNVVDAVKELIAKGYTHDYRLHGGKLTDASTNTRLKFDDFRVEAAFRFESAPDSGDGSNLYAIASRSGACKGLLIDAFDLFDSDENRDALRKLDAPVAVPAFDNSADAPMKYGVRKVFKEEFNEKPDRFVLRKGFPDFPECPFGQAFTMLGYDTQEHQYVWLVTSIIRDPRLRVEAAPN